MVAYPRKESGEAVLITGAGGLLGHPLCLSARQHWPVHAVYRRNPPQVTGINTVQCDLSDLEALAPLLDEVRPKAVIHAAAAAQVGACQAHPRRSEVINVLVPARLAALCADRDIPLVFVSTDLVFDGLAAPYDERCTTAPVCIYGQQKVRAEGEVMGRHPGALVCRMPLMFGLAPHAHDNFTVQMLNAIAMGKPLHLFVDEYRSPVDTASAARGVLAMIGRVRGLVHLGGRTRVSRYELGCMMAAAMGVAPDMIVPTSLTETDLPYPRSPDCTLDSHRAFSLGYDPTPLDRAVAQTVALFSSGRWSGEEKTI